MKYLDLSPEQVYSDPLDALEKAEDTRIYNFPDFDDDPIYEEAVRSNFQVGI